MFPLQHPFLLISNQWLTSREKANIFNSHFAFQCTTVKSTSKLTHFKYKAHKGLTSIDVNEDALLLVIKALNVGKPMGGVIYKWELWKFLVNNLSLPFHHEDVLGSMLHKNVFS